MNVLKINTPTTVTGPNVLGFRSSITFREGPGNGPWNWSRSGKRNTFQNLNTDTVSCSTPRNLAAAQGDHKIQILEHILPLRFLGLQSVSLVAPNRWPPYFMPATFWKQLVGNTVDTGVPVKWNPVSGTTDQYYPDRRNGHIAFTKIEPHDKPTVIAHITISYKGLGEKSKTYDLSNISRDELLRIMSTGPQGWYEPIGLVERAVRLIRWPHANTIVWPRLKSEEERQATLDKFLDHRFLDLLGALALLGTGRHLPAARVTSVCSGHEADTGALKHAELRDLVLTA
jgi:hypothetical protein